MRDEQERWIYILAQRVIKASVCVFWRRVAMETGWRLLFELHNTHTHKAPTTEYLGQWG